MQLAGGNVEKILIVDDSKIAQGMLAEIFNDTYDLNFQDDGLAGIEAARHIKPDLILLDINMPDLDGLEVCRILKKEEETRDIPIIFVTSHDSVDEKVKGFHVGADDYVVKPFYPPELQARVHAHIGLRRARLQSLALERLTVFKEMAIAVSHEINNPLTAVLAYLHILQANLENAPGMVTENITGIYEGTKRIQKIVGRLANATNASKTRYNADMDMIDLHNI